MELKSGIYCIENLINGKKYIGQGIDVKKRMNRNHKDTLAIYNAIKKYGKENFSRKVIVYCEDWELDRLEIECIRIFHSRKSDWGYNILLGGNVSRKGMKNSEESKKKQSELMSGKNHPMYGTHPSFKTMQLMSENHADVNGKNNSRFDTKLLSASSKYYGVSKHIYKEKYVYWLAYIIENKKRKDLGQYKTEIEAALARDKYIIENNLPRKLNFPKECENKQVI